MPRTNLTTAFIDSSDCVCPPGRKSFEYNDSQIIGLYVSVTPAGCKTYRFAFKDAANKRRHIKIGRTTDVTLKSAREAAQKMRTSVAAGDDPAEERQQVKATPTWTAFFEEDYLPHAKQKKRTWKNDAEMHKRRIKDRFGSLKLDRITRRQVEQFHIELRESDLAPATADHYVKFIRCALNLAVDWGILQTNPVSKIKLFNEDNQVERYLTEAELKRLMKVLGDYENRPMACIVLWLLATGARAGEAKAARWEDIDLEHRVWVIQSKTSKSKKRRSVPLNDIALSVLDELKGSRQNPSGHLFIGKRGPYRHLTKNWERLCEAANLCGLRIHDVRHSFASMLVNAGHSLYEVQQALGHSDPKVTMRYSHLTKDTLQKAADSAAERIKAAME